MKSPDATKELFDPRTCHLHNVTFSMPCFLFIADCVWAESPCGEVGCWVNALTGGCPISTLLKGTQVSFAEKH
jgi:hypothetical protein